MTPTLSQESTVVAAEVDVIVRYPWILTPTEMGTAVNGTVKTVISVVKMTVVCSTQRFIAVNVAEGSGFQLASPESTHCLLPLK